jgi:DNA-binding beta-propeller fold protein YncE
VRVTRAGYAPFEGTLELPSGGALERTVSLEPLPIALEVDSEPSGAEVTVHRDGAPPIAGTTPFHQPVPAGPVTVTLAAPGRNPLTLSRFLDRPESLRLWLDPEGQLVHRLRLLPTGREPKQVVISPDGREAWVAALDGPPSVLVHDLESGKTIAELTLGEHGAVEVLFSKDGSRVYASQMETGLVYELDARTHALLRTLDAHGKWSKVLALSADGAHLFVSNWLGKDISELDLASGQLVRKLPAVTTPRGLYATRDGKFLFVAGFERGELGRIDLATGKLEIVFRGGTALRHIVGDEDRGVLYVSDMGKACVWSIDLKTLEARVLVKTDRNPNTIGLSPDRQVLFISCRGKNGPGGYLTVGKESGSVLVVDARTGERLDAIAAGKQPTALAVSSDGSLLVFSDFRDDRLEVYRVPSTGELRAGRGGRSATYRADLEPGPPGPD